MTSLNSFNRNCYRKTSKKASNNGTIIWQQKGEDVESRSASNLMVYLCFFHPTLETSSFLFLTAYPPAIDFKLYLRIHFLTCKKCTHGNWDVGVNSKSPVNLNLLSIQIKIYYLTLLCLNPLVVLTCFILLIFRFVYSFKKYS